MLIRPLNVLACQPAGHRGNTPASLAGRCRKIIGFYKMKRSLGVVIVILTTICLLISPVAVNRATLVGEVNYSYQIVADNEIYEVGDNAVGDDLVFNYIAQKVKVVGQLKESDKLKIITVESFEVVEK